MITITQEIMIMMIIILRLVWKIRVQLQLVEELHLKGGVQGFDAACQRLKLIMVDYEYIKHQFFPISTDAE